MTVLHHNLDKQRTRGQKIIYIPTSWYVFLIINIKPCQAKVQALRVGEIKTLSSIAAVGHTLIQHRHKLHRDELILARPQKKHIA
jgi:hypothetical protein